jgi:uncharacterized protein (DUF58 family)
MAMNPAHAPPATARLIDPKVLMSIESLELRARLVVEGFWSGIHRSPYHGFSVEFTEYRQYTQGDETRYLDWRVFARSDRFFIKKFEDETNLRCYLICDSSKSMTYGSLGYKKREYATTLAASLGYFLYLQGDGVGALTFDEKARDYLPARHRAGHLRELMLALEKPAAGASTNLAAPLTNIARILRKRSLLLFISDFLAPLDKLQRELAALAASGHELILFQTLDPAEIRFEFQGPIMFEDVETGQGMFIEPQLVRGAYLKKMEEHCARLKKLCDELGATFHRLSTERPLELALFDFLRERMQRKGRAWRVTRQRATASARS